MFLKKNGDAIPVTECHPCLYQCSAVAFNLLICKLVPGATYCRNEDTHPIISQNGFDVICLKTCCFSKITNN